MKEKHLKIKRIVAIAIALVLVIANLPMAATRATGEEEQVTEEVNIVVTVTGSDGNRVNKVTFEVKDGYTVVEDEDYVPEETTESTEETSSSTESTDDSTESTDDSTESTDDSTESTDDSTESTDDSTESTDDSTESTDDDTSSTDDEGEVIDPPAEGSMEEQTTVAGDVVAPYGLDRSGEPTKAVTLESSEGVYPLTITKNVDDDSFLIYVYEEGKPEHSYVIEYVDGEEEYNAELVKYAKVTSSNAVFDFETGEYIIEWSYNDGYKDYGLQVDGDTECEVVSSNNSAYIDEWGGVYHVKYSKPGVITLNVTSDEDEKEFEDTVVKLKVNNDLKYLASSASSDVEVETDSQNSRLVDTITKQISGKNSKYSLSLSSSYSGTVSYTIEVLSGAEDDFDINSWGEVTADGMGTVKVTATCRNTGASASYKIKFVPTQEQLSVGYVTYSWDKRDERYEANSSTASPISNGQDLVLGVYSVFDLQITNATEYNYDIQIESENTVIESVDGLYKVSDLLETGCVTVTISATRKNNTEFYDVQDFVFNIYTVAEGADAVVYVKKDGGLIPLSDAGNTNIPYEDNKGKTDIVDGKIYLDVVAEVFSQSSQSQVQDYAVTLSASGLSFNGQYITNVDDIIRNQDYEVTIQISSSRFRTVTAKFIFRLDSYMTNNDANAYYKVTGIHLGADEKSWWKDSEADVLVTGNNGYQISLVDKANGPYGETAKITNYENGQKNKQYLIYAAIIDEEGNKSNMVTTRFYLGVDMNAPKITGVEHNGYVIPGSDIIYANKDITINVDAKDAEKFLFDAALYVGDTKLGESVEIVQDKDDKTKGKCSFVIKLPSESKLYENVTIEVRDLAKNTSDRYSLGSILFDAKAPTVTFTPVASGVNSYSESGNRYYSGDIDVKINIVDKASESDVASGFSEYQIYVNGNYYTTTSDNGFTVNTLNKYGGDGKVVIEVKNIKDNAGNENVAGDKFVLYIDKEMPEVTFEKANKDGNITMQGNFYKEEVTYTFSIGQDLSGIKSAVVKVGSKTYNPTISGSKLTVTMKAKDNGNVSLVLKDNVGNEKVYDLNKMKNTPFKSNYVIVDMQQADISFVGIEENNVWYKDAVTLTVDISDVAKSDISSGIASAVIKVNGKVYAQYSANRFVGDKKTKDTFTVVIDTNWINDVINDAGSYTVSVEVYDNAGVQSTNDITVHIDMVDPEIKEFTGVANGSVNTGVVTLNVSVEEKHYAVAGNNVTVTVKKTLDGVTTDYPVRNFEPNAITTSQVYTFNQDGTYVVTVSAIDAAGNPAIDKTITFTIDNTAPSPDISGVTENYYYTDGRDVTLSIEESNFENMNVTISIEKELNGTKTVIDSADMNKTGKISTLTQSFTEEGTYTIKVDAVDAAGNSAVTRTVIFTIDNANPVINITGVENGAAYKDAVIPSITITDNYFASDYTVTLTKNGVKFDGSKLGVNSSKSVNVTDTYIGKFSSIENGVNSVSDTFEMIQDNDGIYTLTVVATDKSGRTSQEVVNFSVNRFGSVYTFDENLVSLMGSVNTEITEDIKITEFNPNRLLADSIEIAITRDGALVDSITVSKTEATTENVIGESGWYQYDYVISKDNFANDGLYVITVSSKDEAGNNSENITYDQLSIRFAVDTTKPEVVKITGLSKTTYDANSITVSYEVYDAVGIREVRVFLNGNVIQTITEFGDDNTAYAGSFVIEEGIDQHISFQVVDIAGNVVDSDNPDDVNSGKIVNFKDTVTVSTNVLIRWYANKTAFYGSIIAAVVVIVGIVAFVVFRKKKTR